ARHVHPPRQARRAARPPGARRRRHRATHHDLAALPATLLLMKRAARRVAVLGHVRRPEVREAAKKLRASLVRAGHEVRLDEELSSQMGESGWPLARLAAWCQLLVTLGGDGTALTGGRALLGRRGALLPVNLGGLGFLAVAEGRELGE